jgi:phage terminase large subunit
MFFCLWIAVDETGRCFVYRSFNEPNMRVSEAAEKQLELTRPDENIHFSIAPPDMWSRNRDSGKTQAAMFADHGVGLVRADNNRKQGWAAMKEMFRVRNEDGRPGLILFDTCGTLIDCIKSLQHDKNDPNDVMDKPHDITHGPDALRYFCQTYVLPAEAQREAPEEEEETDMDYQTAMCGGKVSRSYICA